LGTRIASQRKEVPENYEHQEAGGGQYHRIKTNPNSTKNGKIKELEKKKCRGKKERKTAKKTNLLKVGAGKKGSELVGSKGTGDLKTERKNTFRSARA